MEEIEVFKLVRVKENKLVSYFVGSNVGEPNQKVEYKLETEYYFGEVTKEKYGPLYAFDCIENAQHFFSVESEKNGKLFRCKATKSEHPNTFKFSLCGRTITEWEKYIKETTSHKGSWATGTVACATIQLVEEIDISNWRRCYNNISLVA